MPHPNHSISLAAPAPPGTLFNQEVFFECDACGKPRPKAATPNRRDPTASGAPVWAGFGGDPAEFTGLRRLTEELDRFVRDADELGGLTFVEMAGAPFGVFDCSIVAPRFTPYFGATFAVVICVPPRYPFEPPTVFMPGVFHPAVDPKSGQVRTATLKDMWSSAYTLRTILEDLRGLLGSGSTMPEPGADAADDAAVPDGGWANVEAAGMWDTDREQYFAAARRSAVAFGGATADDTDGMYLRALRDDEMTPWSTSDGVIHVRELNGRSHAFEDVKPSDSIASIMVRVREQTCTPLVSRIDALLCLSAAHLRRCLQSCR